MNVKMRYLTCLGLMMTGAVLALAEPTAREADFRAVPQVPQQQQPPPQQQQELEISLNNPAVHPKLGLPGFVTPEGDAELAEAARLLADVLWADLDFEREYYMIARKASASLPMAATADAIPVAQWRELGADAVMIGSLSRAGQNFTVDLKVISIRGVTTGQMAFGSTYENCTIRNPRFCAHSIADNFHKLTRGLDGVARTKLAFASDRDGTRMANRPVHEPGVGKEIYLTDYDGANQRRFTVNQSLNISPAWAPFGGQLGYVSYASGVPDLYIASLSEAGRAVSRPVAGTLSVQNWFPAWSPDAKRIAFASTRAGNLDIWVANVDGTGLLNLTPDTPRSAESKPTWSPDGRQIAFTSDRQGRNQIFVMSAEGTGRQVIVSQKSDCPTWSALGFIAFTLETDAGQEVAIFDWQTRQISVLTDGRGQNESPAISPSGRHVAFVTTRWGKEQIAIIDRRGENLRRITEVGNNRYPSWQPIGR
jgi:TolB protein